MPDPDGVMMYDYGGSICRVYNPKVVAGEGLRYHYNFYQAGIEKAKEYFLNSADWLVKNATDKQGYSLWEYTFPWMFYGGIKPPYASALAQAEGAELLAKAYLATTKEEYLQAASKAVAALSIEYDNGGVMTIEDNGRSLFMHLLAKQGFKKIYVLNGHTGALLHLWEYCKMTGNALAKGVFEKGTRYLKNHLPEFDCGDWSYYDKEGTLAMESYHKGQISQLGQLYEITREPRFDEYKHKFLIYFQHGKPKGRERKRSQLPPTEPN